MKGNCQYSRHLWVRIIPTGEVSATYRKGDGQHSRRDGLERSVGADFAPVLSCLRERMMALIGEVRTWLDVRFLYFPAMVQIDCFVGRFWSGLGRTCV